MCCTAVKGLKGNASFFPSWRDSIIAWRESFDRARTEKGLVGWKRKGTDGLRVAVHHSFH